MTEPMRLQRVRRVGASPFPLSAWLQESFSPLSRRRPAVFVKSTAKIKQHQIVFGAPFAPQPALDDTVLRFLHAQFQHLFQQRELDPNYAWAVAEHLNLLQARRTIEMLQARVQRLQMQISSGQATPAAVSEAVEPVDFEAAETAPEQPPSRYPDDELGGSLPRPSSSPPPPSISLSLVMQFLRLRDLHPLMSVCRLWSACALEPMVWAGRSCSVLLTAALPNKPPRLVFQPNLEAEEQSAVSLIKPARAKPASQPFADAFLAARLYRHCPTLEIHKSCRKQLTGPLLDQVLGLLPSLTSLSVYCNHSAATRLLLSHPLLLRARILRVDLGRSVTARITRDARYSSDDDDRPVAAAGKGKLKSASAVKSASAAKAPSAAKPAPMERAFYGTDDEMEAQKAEDWDEDEDESSDDEVKGQPVTLLTPMEAAASSAPFAEIVRGLARCTQLRQLSLRLMHDACEQQLHAVDVATLLEATPQLEGLSIESPCCSPDLPLTRALHLTSLSISLSITQVERLCAHADALASLRSLHLTLGLDGPSAGQPANAVQRSNRLALGSCSDAQVTESNRLSCLARLPALTHLTVLLPHCAIDPLGPLRTAQQLDAAAFQQLRSFTCIGELSSSRPSICAQLPASALLVPAASALLLPFPHLTCLHLSCCHSARQSSAACAEELASAFPHVRRLCVHGLELQGLRSTLSVAPPHRSWPMLHTLLIDHTRLSANSSVMLRPKPVPCPLRADDLTVLHALSSLPSLLLVVLPQLCRLDRRELRELMTLRRVQADGSGELPLPEFVVRTAGTKMSLSKFSA